MIHIMCGSTGAGKTYYAKTLAKERGAVLFCIDDWMSRLFFPDLCDTVKFEWAMERIERCEAQIWEMVGQLLNVGKEVVLEISMSTKALRAKQLARARETGFPHQLYYFDIDREIRRQRVRTRNLERNATFSFEVDDAMFDFVEKMFETPIPEELEGAVIVRHSAARTSFE